MKRTQANDATGVDPITALHNAIILASEQGWQWNSVSHEERERLRPAVAAIAKNATDQLRAEHAMRAGRP